MEEHKYSFIREDVRLGEGVRMIGFVNLYGCSVGDETFIGPFVEIQSDATIGRRCKIQSHTFICEGVEVEDEVFVGHGVLFTNDRLPRAADENGELLGPEDWTLERTYVRKGASIGSGAVILPGVEIGRRALVGAGAVVTRDVGPGETVWGVPARAKHRSGA